ncbi:MAG: hypothetical protein JNN04_03480 [Cyclobacteriaceae bacterium]|nr:hypothetical protein [Cyclobacteriaceae bacterium]
MRSLFAALFVCLAAFSAFSQEIPYTVCENCWNPDSLGNHRAVVTVPAPGKSASVRIEWRRRDLNPERKMILVTDEKGNLIANVGRRTVNREYGEVFFEPAAGGGIYFVYYLKYYTKGRSNYPTVIYPEYKETAAPVWAAQMTTKPVTATVKEFQSIDALNSFYPMEVIATQAATDALREKSAGKPFLVFPEDRMFPVKMRTDLPQRWILRGPSDVFEGTADKGENYAFQLGLWAHAGKVENVKVSFSDLTGPKGTIAGSGLSCLNTTGIAWNGQPFEKDLDVEAGNVQALWCLLTVPGNTAAGEYTGTATVRGEGAEPRNITIRLTVTENTAPNGGIDEPWKQTRLAWLNSTLAATNEVIAPYAPIELKGNSLAILGRKLEISENGLPKQVTTYFSQYMTRMANLGKPLLSAPFEFQALRANKTPMRWTPSKKLEIRKESDGAASWSATTGNESLSLEVSGRLEFDGFVMYTMKLTALKDVRLGDTWMRMPIRKPFAKYMMGLGQRGGLRPANFKWNWDVATENQDGAWIGDVNGGMQFSLRAENYVRPLNTNFYLQKPLNLPPSWGNEGKGGITITENAMTATLTAYSGAREMKAGETLYYNFTLLLTPFHTLDTDFQWKTRFYHKYSPVDTILRRGATVANIHHANEINPYINYPFLRVKEMKAYIDEAHQKGLKVKIYNTVRELSNRAYETPALRSLGTEIYSPGAGGGFSWLQEHLGDNYIAAWFVPELKDAAIINSGMSRWHNYYVEGMNWLVKNVGIDGIYLDDVAFDRTTMKRIRRVLKSDRGPGIIDLHSANQYNKRDGFNNSANLYLEHFPYLNRLWFGEYFDYDSKPDFWITEVSGIPFGLMGEMLEKGGNPWRGMVYGMTNRMPWTENSDPSHLWKVWDDFGMKGSEMIGYWVDPHPVKTNNPEVLATVYKRNDRMMVAVASWAASDVNVKLTIDWKALGLKPTTTAEAPGIQDFQEKQSINLADGFTIPKGKGLIIIIK